MPVFISIIIPLYNKEHYIRATLNSVLNQTFSNFEIIIVNDGSTDNSLELVKAIKDNRIRIFTIKNQGVSYARNYGIKKATGKLIAFLDADDFWFSNHLEVLERLYSKFPEAALFCTAYQKKIKNTIIPSYYNTIPSAKNWMGIIDDYFLASTVNCIAWTSAVMITKEHVTKLNGFDETITMGAGEDIDLWLRCALKYPIAFSNTVTAYHILNADNRLSNSDTETRNFINLDKYENQAKTNSSLKKYLDLNRFSIAIKFKLANNQEMANKFSNNIDSKNLNYKQKIILSCNTKIIKQLIRLQKFFRSQHVFLSAFKG